MDDMLLLLSRTGGGETGRCKQNKNAKQNKRSDQPRFSPIPLLSSTRLLRWLAAYSLSAPGAPYRSLMVLETMSGIVISTIHFELPQLRRIAAS